MHTQLWSWLLTAVSILVLWLIGNRHRWAWPIALGGQAVWVTYAVTTDQPGFLCAALVYIAVYLRNWRRDARSRPQGTAVPRPAEQAQACTCGHPAAAAGRPGGGSPRSTA